MAKIYFSLLAILLVLTGCSADDAKNAVNAKGAVLFKQYKYGQSISEFPVGNEYEDCSADMGKLARCAEGIDFMGSQYSLALIFQDNALESVSLFTEFSEDIYRKLMASLPKNGFTLSVMQGESERLDVIETINKESRDVSISKISAFESINLSGGQLTYVFLESPIEDLKKYKGAVDAITKLPAKTRELDMTVAEDEESAQIVLKFGLPKITMRSVKVSKEKF
jgi:hypothetical protein